MRIRPLWIVVGILLLPTAAAADDHRADLFGGLSYMNASALWGFHATVAVTSAKPPSRNLALLGDVSFHSGTHEGIDLKLSTFLGGVRWAFAGPADGAEPKHVVAAHALVGGIRSAIEDDDSSELNGAIAVGASWDFVPNRGATGGGWGIRVQADYIIGLGNADNFPRVSAGAVYRFGQ